MKDAVTGAMQLEQAHIDALDKAETMMFHSDFCPYLELKALFPDPSPLARDRFRTLFTNYYALNTGGLTPEFKVRFFKLLFEANVIVNGRPDFVPILRELSEIKRKTGNYAMPFSFVSKLVATHCESSPIYDRHVLAFFEQKIPAASVEKTKRIEWYVNLLDCIRNSYIAWACDPRIVPLLSRLKDRDARLIKCNDVRLMDFLVWKVGNQKLLTK